MQSAMTNARPAVGVRLGLLAFFYAFLPHILTHPIRFLELFNELCFDVGDDPITEDFRLFRKRLFDEEFT